jgi:hypothetical protein
MIVRDKALAAAEIKTGWVLHVDGEDRTVHNYRFRAPSGDELERRMTIWFTDGHQVFGDEGQTVYVVSEGS